jgi:UDP:flavonoid glycosyltransferase YjiC (YdhE family)
VPFFGDQFFWGAAVHRMGLGPPPVPAGELSTGKLADALRAMRHPEVCAAAAAVAEKIAKVGRGWGWGCE